MKRVSSFRRGASWRPSWFFLLVMLATAQCGTSSDPGSPMGTAGGSGGAAGSSSGGPGGAAGSSGAATGGAAGTTGGTAGSAGASGNGGGLADASSDTGGLDAGDQRDAGGGGDRTTEDRAGDGWTMEPGCSYATPPSPPCYVAGSPPTTPLVRCWRVPSGINGADGMTYRWRNNIVYWVNGKNIVRLNGATTEAVTVSNDVATLFEVDEDAVYYGATSDAGSLVIRRAKLDSSGTTTVASDVRGFFVLNGDRLYFDTTDGRFVSTSKLGGGSVDPVAAPSSVERLRTSSGVLMDATHLYWNEGTDNDVTLLRLAKGGTTVETVATHLPAGAALLQGDSVFLVAEGKYILEMPKSGGCPLAVVGASPATSLPLTIGAMAADDTSIYWATTYPSDTSDLLVYRAPRRGGVAIEVISAGSGIRGWSTVMLAPLLTPTQVFVRGDGRVGGHTLFALARP
jgi:hypothetical protein